MHDWRALTLRTWGAWVAAGRPIEFSIYGDSIHARGAFVSRHRREYRGDVPLWQESGNDWLHRLDSRIHGALGERGRLILLAAMVPMGRVCPASERAAAACCTVEQMRAVRRRAMALVG